MKLNLLILSILFFQFSFGQFSRNYNKYEGEIELTYNTPNVSFYKYIKNGDTTYQTAFYIYDTYLTTGSGVILLFSNGDKIEYTNDVDVKYAYKGYYRYTFYFWTKEVVEKLSNTSLIGYKLHIFEKDLTQQNRNLIMTAAKKILVSK
jgi:hypothetical protein